MSITVHVEHLPDDMAMDLGDIDVSAWPSREALEEALNALAPEFEAREITPELKVEMQRRCVEVIRGGPAVSDEEVMTDTMEVLRSMLQPDPLLDAAIAEEKAAAQSPALNAEWRRPTKRADDLCFQLIGGGDDHIYAEVWVESLNETWPAGVPRPKDVLYAHDFRHGLGWAPDMETGKSLALEQLSHAYEMLGRLFGPKATS